MQVLILDFFRATLFLPIFIYRTIALPSFTLEKDHQPSTIDLRFYFYITITATVAALIVLIYEYMS